jgi:hypothetical protein
MLAAPSGAVRWVPNTGSAAISTNVEFPVLGNNRDVGWRVLNYRRRHWFRTRTTATGPLILNESYYPIISNTYSNSCDSTYVSTVDRSLPSPRLLALRRPSRCHRKASCRSSVVGPPAPMDSSHHPTETRRTGRGDRGRQVLLIQSHAFALLVPLVRRNAATGFHAPSGGHRAHAAPNPPRRRISCTTRSSTSSTSSGRTAPSTRSWAI